MRDRCSDIMRAVWHRNTLPAVPLGDVWTAPAQPQGFAAGASASAAQLSVQRRLSIGGHVHPKRHSVTFADDSSSVLSAPAGRRGVNRFSGTDGNRSSGDYDSPCMETAGFRIAAALAGHHGSTHSLASSDRSGAGSHASGYSSPESHRGGAGGSTGASEADTEMDLSMAASVARAGLLPSMRISQHEAHSRQPTGFKARVDALFSGSKSVGAEASAHGGPWSSALGRHLHHQQQHAPSPRASTLPPVRFSSTPHHQSSHDGSKERQPPGSHTSRALGRAESGLTDHGGIASRGVGADLPEVLAEALREAERHVPRRRMSVEGLRRDPDGLPMGAVPAVALRDVRSGPCRRRVSADYTEQPSIASAMTGGGAPSPVLGQPRPLLAPVPPAAPQPVSGPRRRSSVEGGLTPRTSSGGEGCAFSAAASQPAAVAARASVSDAWMRQVQPQQPQQSHPPPGEPPVVSPRRRSSLRTSVSFGRHLPGGDAAAPFATPGAASQSSLPSSRRGMQRATSFQPTAHRSESMPTRLDVLNRKGDGISLHQEPTTSPPHAKAAASRRSLGARSSSSSAWDSAFSAGGSVPAAPAAAAAAQPEKRAPARRHSLTLPQAVAAAAGACAADYGGVDEAFMDWALEA